MKTFNKKLQICLRNYIKFIVFFIIFFVLTESMLFIIDYIMHLRKMASYDNKPYSNASKIFVIKSDERSVDLSFLQEDNIMEDCVLLKYDSDNGMYEVIWADLDSVKWKEINVTGLDYKSQYTIAAVGIDVKKHINDKIEIEDNSYPVKAKLDRHISSAVNNGIFYTKCNIENVQTNLAYVLASSDDKTVKKAYGALCDLLAGKNVSVVEVKMDEAKLSDYISYVNSLKYMIYLLILFYICMGYLVYRLWKHINKKYVFINEILGNHLAVMEVSIKLIVIVVFAGITAFMVFRGIKLI